MKIRDTLSFLLCEIFAIAKVKLLLSKAHIKPIKKITTKAVRVTKVSMVMP